MWWHLGYRVEDELLSWFPTDQKCLVFHHLNHLIYSDWRVVWGYLLEVTPSSPQQEEIHFAITSPFLRCIMHCPTRHTCILLVGWTHGSLHLCSKHSRQPFLIFTSLVLGRLVYTNEKQVVMVVVVFMPFNRITWGIHLYYMGWVIRPCIHY